MKTKKICALSHPNIAFIKYWGNQVDSINLPSNGSISMNLSNLETITEVHFNSKLLDDELFINGVKQSERPLSRVTAILDIVRNQSNVSLKACVSSTNNFPLGAGIASSASAFAALALAASKAAGLHLSQIELSKLARKGAGSACRSIPGGFVEWIKGSSDEDSYAIQLAPPEHWQLNDCIAITDEREKKVSSSTGHQMAPSSPLQQARIASSPIRMDICRSAIK
ncbi:MAG: diphosphomevalonate decarboxylase, partial [Anaerolineaceae bacterium]|nr:diphosphomevalonate decarboxylase [Anaerolineaceae bacterium]